MDDERDEPHLDPERIAAQLRAAHAAHQQVEEELIAAGRDPIARMLAQVMPAAEQITALGKPSRWTVLSDAAAEWLKALALAAIAAALWWRL